MTQAIATYIAADGVQVMPLLSFLTLILGFDREEALAIEEEIETQGIVSFRQPNAMEPEEGRGERPETV